MNKHLIAIALSVALITLAGCADDGTAQSAPAQQQQAIDVAEVLVKPVQSWHTYTTRLESPQKVALMPRVSGIIEQIAERKKRVEPQWAQKPRPESPDE